MVVVSVAAAAVEAVVVADPVVVVDAGVVVAASAAPVDEVAVEDFEDPRGQGRGGTSAGEQLEHATAAEVRQVELEATIVVLDR